MYGAYRGKNSFPKSLSFSTSSNCYGLAAIISCTMMLSYGLYPAYNLRRSVVRKAFQDRTGHKYWRGLQLKSNKISTLKRGFGSPLYRASSLSTHAGKSESIIDLINSEKPLILRSKCTDIFVNLALEQYLFKTASLGRAVMLSYRNDKTIVIGRHQNPWKECRVQKMEEDGIALCRRASGGGAVYQDLGNTCFSFLNEIPSSGSAVEAPSVDFKSINNEILTAALSRLDIEAQASGRNDIEVNYDGASYKISGSAYKLKNDSTTGRLRSLHHGTMLLNVDTNALSSYLTPDATKLKSKGISSVKSRVKNLIEVNPDITHEDFVEALETEFLRQRVADAQMATISQDEALAIPEVKEEYQNSREWEWRFGSSPAFSVEFSRRFPWALMTIHLDARKGRVYEGKVFSDCLKPDFVDALNEILSNPGQTDMKKLDWFTYDAEGVRSLVTNLSKVTGAENDEQLKGWISDIEDWMMEEIVEGKST